MLKDASRDGNKEIMELVRELFKIEEGQIPDRIRGH
jgi:hypothetical protein